ncbi:serine protease inhibitor I/II-like isoform X2 [Bradysia coprophila]|uniref:serine protease inhibitor I/II-like isoform X2 n=1 Tax=Bradysia coprophila TaxID=38358 RepID=UPI00187DCF4D|nr:serine protease inhibitor I/II-like isoform X2 [Bradysia coprophila]
MGFTKVFLTVLSTLMIFHFCAGANLRLKRSEGGVTDSNLDANGRCITARNWKQECNDCWCVENGVPACTLKGCIQAPVPIESHTEDSANMERCVPGSQWKEDCNSCWCTDNGLSICTKIGCVRL